MNINDTQLVHSHERVDLFLDGDLRLIQSKDYFTISVDAVLLAHFTNLPKRRPFRYIDFCSGNGAIPLLLAHKTSESLRGIELQAGLVDMAQRSAQLNGLEDRVSFINQDLKDFNPPQGELYDIITCNPPYFKVEDTNAVHTKDSHALARHEISLTLEDWVFKASRIMREKGRLFIVHRPERLDEIMSVLLAHQFSIYRIKFVHPKAGLNANGVLIEAIYRGGRGGVRVEPPIIVHTDDDEYTPMMKEIYRHG